jgi:membrane protein required for colicin V production
MTGFDVAAGLLLLVSALIGLSRGATREVTMVLASVVASVMAVFALRITGPVARRMIHAPWLANVVAILVVFILAYVVLRLIGGALTRSVQQTSLSGLDRLLGLGIGLVRALVVLGGFALLLEAATPPERMPQWVTQAKLYPLAAAAGGALRAFAPEGLKVAHDMAPDLANAVTGQDDPAQRIHVRRRRRDDDGASAWRGNPDTTPEETP